MKTVMATDFEVLVDNNDDVIGLQVNPATGESLFCLWRGKPHAMLVVFC